MDEQLRGATDGELLAAFAERGHQSAFGELVLRYGTMVHGVCRRVVRDHHEAEDVAQVVFLTLARKAGSLRRDASVGGWLYTVARRLAKDVRNARYRRQAREVQAMHAQVLHHHEPAAEPGLFRERLDNAIAALPERYRHPLVLFHLRGCSLEQTARQLRLNINTVCTRLARARERLRRNLVRGGVTVGSVDVLTNLLSAEAGATVLPSSFVAATCQAASLVAAGQTLTGSGLVSAKVAYLTKGALKTLFWAKVKTAAAAVVLTAGVATGGGFVAHQALGHREAAVPAVVVPAPAKGGQVWAWGNNGAGQLGDGTTNNSPIPVPVPGLDGVLAVAAGSSHTVALKSDRTVWAWGVNGHGQLGDGTTASRASPVQVKLPDGTPLRGIVAVAAGQGHTVVLSEDSTVWTWGGNMDGQLGDGTRVDRLRPTRVAGLSGVAAIAAGTEHTMALKTDTTVWMWGKIRAGSRGLMPTPEQVKMADGSPLAGVSAVAAGQHSAVALRGDCSVWIWGELTAGRDVPVQAKLRDGTPISEVVSISACSFWMVLLKNDSSVWERELSRDAKSGLSDSVIVPVQLAPGGGIQLSGISAIAVGGEQALALRRDGSVWVWRQSITGPSPVEQVRGLANAVAIAAGARHGVALTGELPSQRPVVEERRERR